MEQKVLCLVFRENIYLDEEKESMHLKQQNTKEWFNSYLTFQHIKKNSSRNLVNQHDRDNMWLPMYNDVNTYSVPQRLCKTDDTLEIIPQPNFNFILNSKTDHNNARLFEVDILNSDKSPRREMADLCV